jgi:hypothetical protein
MNFIQKNVNFGLLIIIIILAITMATIGLYYNYNYTSLSKDYKVKLDTLQQVQQDLFFHKSILNKTTSDLQTKEEDESALGTRYSKLSEEKLKVDKDNEQLRTELLSKNSELVQKTNELLSSKSQVAALTLSNDDLSERITVSEAKARSLTNHLNSVCTACGSDCDSTGYCD